MSNKILILVLCGLFSGLPAFAQTIVPGGNVSGTWPVTGSPYNVQGNITIQADSTLIIEPGVEVNFQGNYSFTVNGLLQAMGTAVDSIHFTAVTNWQGLTFANAPDSSHLAYCTISRGNSLGGIWCTNSNPVITHSTIRNNNGTISGGIFLSSSNPSITYCTISNNTSYQDGGGIRSASSSPYISHCNITGNHSSGYGGGIYVVNGNPSISNCIISDNKTSSGGGIAFSGGGQVTITDCVITADTATVQGGGIYVSSAGGSLTITNSTISHCNAYSGGGIYISQANSVFMTGCTFKSNIVNGMGGGGAVYINQAGTVSILRTTLDDNYCGGLSNLGGVIYSVNCSNLNIDHCNVVNNRAALVEGGVFLNGNSTMTLKNSIFRNQMGPHLAFWAYTSASVSYNDIYGGSVSSGGPPGLGVLTTVNANGDSCDVYFNIRLNPQFVDFANGEYHLTSNSPCIDAGDPASPYDPDGTITDMGRYFFDQGGTGIPGGYVSGTWTAAGSPYRILGDITVHTDSTLNIQPGVEVEFQGHYSLTVNGYLQAIGTEADSIHFMPVTTWKGLYFENAPDSSHLAYCTVSGANLGGINCYNSNPVITHSTISNNHGLGIITGAGISLSGSNPTISYCTISNNTNDANGAGISISGSPQISHCDISGNSSGAGGDGGGIYIHAGNPSFDHCTISDNYTLAHGAGFAIGGFGGGTGQVTITDCIIAANSAHIDGGGIHIGYAGISVTINNSTISNCSSDQSGGGVYISDAAVVSITDCVFESNFQGASGEGGSAIYIVLADTVSLMRTTLDGNYAAGAVPGGVIASVDCDNLILNHCNVVNNHASLDQGGIYLIGNTALTVVNSIFRNQTGPHIGFQNYTSASVSYNDFYDPSSYAFGGNVPPGLGAITTVNANGDSCDVFQNIYLDPLFVDFAGGDYHLTENSPCIDAGDPNSPLDPDGTISDMGAWYFHQSPLIFASDSLLDFGLVDIGQQMDLPLTIRNDGTIALRLQNVSNQNSVFTHNWNPADSLILPNDSLTITVTFTPVDTNLTVDTLLVENNDKPLQVGLSGKGKVVVGIENQSELPKVYALYPAYPNPFNPSTTIRFDLPKSGEVQLVVYDILGRKVATLLNKKMLAGRYEVSWGAASYTSGLYFYQLEADNFIEVRKMLLVK